MEQQNKIGALEDLDVVTKEKIELLPRNVNQKIVLTITRRQYYDPYKHKIITDQVVHRARYRLGRKMKDDK